jgi:hypothetical protein
VYFGEDIIKEKKKKKKKEEKQEKEEKNSFPVPKGIKPYL